MSVVDDLLEATAVALQRLPPTVLSAEALLIATTEMLAAIIEGHGVMAQERMLAMAYIASTTRCADLTAAFDKSSVGALSKWC